MFAKLLAPLRSIGLKKLAKIILLFLIPSFIVGFLDEYFSIDIGVLNVVANLSLGACLFSFGFLLLVDSDYEITSWFTHKKSNFGRIFRGLVVLAFGLLILFSVFFPAT